MRELFSIFVQIYYLTTTENNPPERVLRRRRDDIFLMNILWNIWKMEKKARKYYKYKNIFDKFREIDRLSQSV